MKGYLVVNHFLRNEKFMEIYRWLIEAAKHRNIELYIRTNVEMMVCIGEDKCYDADFILFWDKDIKLARYLEVLGYPVFNKASAIENCDNKALTHIVLARAGVKMPKTMIAPMTYENIGYSELSFLEQVEEELGYPMVVKEVFGSFGQQVYLCQNRDQVKEHLTGNVIFQEYKSSSFGRDLRLQVVGNRVITAMYRYSENGDFRANISNGGKMKPYVPNREQTEMALRCVKALELDFAGVDLLFGDEGEPILCEVNSNAHFKNIYDCTKVNTADFILDHILSEMKRAGK